VSLARYATVVAGIVGGSLLLAWPFLGSLGRQGRLAAACGGSVAAANALLAHVLVLWTEGRSTNVFLGTILGGMVGRMALMLAAVVVAVLGFGLPKVPLAVALLSYFVVLLVLELSVLHRRTSQPEAR
jgi:hypothetical protein